MEDKLTLVVADRIVDGTRRGPLADAYVAIQNDRVLEVGPLTAAAARFPASVRRLTFEGCTIIPGLVDSHVHLTFSAGPMPFQDLQGESDWALLLRAAANARAALQAGVTTMRDLGSRGRLIFELRDAIAKGIIPGPRILSSGAPITCPGGHLHFLGGVTQGRDGVTRLADKLVEDGADVIKVIATGGNMTQGSDPLQAQFSVEELRAAVEVGNAAGLRTTVHARGVEGIRVAVRAGVHGIEHARMEVAPGKWEFDEELAREMAARGITAAPTFAASFRAFQCAAAGGRIGLRAGAIPIPVRQANARRLRECGVPVVVGTDAGAALARFEEAINVELEVLVGAGWTPLEALEAGTIGSAEAIGRAKDVGSLEAGKFADFVVVRGDPTRDITNVRQVERVVIGGRMVVADGQVGTDSRPHPWPLDEITERPSLLASLK